MAQAVATSDHRTRSHAAALPSRLKVLFVAAGSGAATWLAEAVAAEGATQFAVEEAIGVTAGLSILRDETFDAILIAHEPGVLDGLDFITALRTSGHDEPLIVLGADPPATLDALCYEAGADDYCCLAETTVRGLLWKFARAIQRFTLARENRRLLQAERQRLQHEHHEAERLLEQQRALIDDLEELSEGRRSPTVSLSLASDASDDETEAADAGIDLLAFGATATASQLSPDLVAHYREMLRAYVIMGAGNLSAEMTALATLLADTNVSARRTMQLHLQVLEELVQGLGNRSARHVMNRADLLALEVMSHLADGYRQRYHERRHPAQQRLLPGFDWAAA
jgi:DNA-binding response OmpR family regulator